jgi:hypothetical protein
MIIAWRSLGSGNMYLLIRVSVFKFYPEKVPLPNLLDTLDIRNFREDL